MITAIITFVKTYIGTLKSGFYAIIGIAIFCLFYYSVHSWHKIDRLKKEIAEIQFASQKTAELREQTKKTELAIKQNDATYKANQKKIAQERVDIDNKEIFRKANCIIDNFNNLESVINCRNNLEKNEKT